MEKCLICKKFGRDSKHPTSVCVLFHGIDGNGGRIAASKVPPEYRYMMIDDVPFEKEMFGAYVESFKKMFNQIHTTQDRVKSLYLWSTETGTGKTTVASALLNEYHLAHVMLSYKLGKQPKDYPTFFLDTNELQELFNRFNRQGVSQDVREAASEEYYRRLDIAKEASLIVADDIGIRSATEAFRGDLHTVITVQQMPTIYTSNLPIQSLVDVYDKRLYDRVRDLTVEIEFKGSSFRGLR
jgi:DNA replication protein DnaC